MAKMVRLWMELASRSRGFAVLMIPLSASTLKKRSRSVFLSMEYLDTNKMKCGFFFSNDFKLKPDHRSLKIHKRTSKWNVTLTT